MKNLNWISSITLIILSCIVVGLFYVSTTRNIERIYVRDTEEAIYKIKQQFLKETVNNQITRIDQRRAEEKGKYQEASLQADQIFKQLSKGDFPKYFAVYFVQRIENRIWDACLWDLETGNILFDPAGLLQGSGDPESRLKSVLDSYAVFTVTEYHGYGTFYGVLTETIDDVVKSAITEEIHNSEFIEDTYIWVNEVVDYAGGDRYAIRRIHPNLRDTEGIYLSTSMTDIMGNFPYLEELEGVKKDGELFFTYFFKRINSDEISEKLTYSKLYEDYNWIVAMGIHLDDLASYVQIANEKSSGYTSSILPIFLVVLVALVAFSYISLIFLERLKSSRVRKTLETQANFDTLTGIPNRRLGAIELAKVFKEFRNDFQNSPAIMLFDLDDFKQINDTYGHATGDLALQFVTNSVAALVRSSDRLYRWGGDEFLLVCPGAKQDNISRFSQAILDGVSIALSKQKTCPCKQLTISMGVTYFHAEDTDHKQALSRADSALYTAKRSGKNRIEIHL